MTAQNAGIIGMGHAYPKGILTNADLEKIVETSDEWITSRTGIKQQHKAADNEYTSQFGTAAVVLPEPDSPILTRELLYTAVTRARRELIVVGGEASIRAAVARPVARASGLRALLTG